MNYNQIKTIDISNINKNNCFLHYTHQKNINSIFDFGLEPRIGKNSMAIEKSKKIFFTMGFDNTLILMDAWIKWLVLRPRSNFVYRCGAFFMTKSYFPKFIVDTIFKTWIKSDKRIKYACKKLNRILNDSVFLLLDLEENVDFKYNDIDEVKNQKFSRKQLKYIYTYCDNIEDSTIEKWNMHTLSNRIIEKEKITLLSINDSFKASDIVEYMFKQSNIKFSEQLPFLNKYINDYILKK
ncbi:MAG: hypothetical protein J6K23_02470 [Bacilli bacterium]|nr:hypothetical protein [Bacilli bacterium]